MLNTLSLFGFGPHGWGALLALGLLITVLVTLGAMVVGALIGALAAWGKLSGNPVGRFAADAYTTIFRGVPELLVIFLFYFGGSSAVSGIGHLFGHEGFIGFPAFAAGALAVGIISGAYQAEVFRGAFRAVARG